MKIETITEKVNIVELNSLKPGDVFAFNNVLYLVLSSESSSRFVKSGTDTFAANLQTGDLIVFWAKTEVIQWNAKVIASQMTGE